jgi:kynureninase
MSKGGPFIKNVRNLFEIPEDVTYLNCANMAPQLKSVTEAGINAVRAKESPWSLAAPQWFSGAETLRALAARLMGVETDGIALVPAVSYGVAIAARNLKVAPTQTIVLLDQEFPSDVYTCVSWHAKPDAASSR